MKFLITVLILSIVLICGCTQNNPKENAAIITQPVPNQTSICKGTARCYQSTVTRIVDGDTLYVNNDSIRLTLVDAPEYNEEGGNEATELASSICPIGSKAIVDEDDGQTAGSYGRIVAVVYCNARNLNAELIINGYATIYEEFCNVSEFANEDWVKRYGC
jgi:endonuclease YncB( thermonuclease family)